MADIKNVTAEELQKRLAEQAAQISDLQKKLDSKEAEQAAQISTDTLDYKRRVYVRNVTGVDTYIRLRERVGDAMVPKNGRALFTIGEVLEQVLTARNRSFIGADGNGNFASLYIEDEPARKAAGLGDNQKIVDEAAILKLFETDGKKFEAALKANVTTFGAKQSLKGILARGKINDHEKIKIAEGFLKGA